MNQLVDGKTFDGVFTLQGDTKCHIVGCRAARSVSASAFGADAQGYREDLIRRQIEFVSSLIDPHDERITYDLRLIAQPDSGGVFTRGCLTLALLCRLDGATRQEAEMMGGDLYRLIEAHFDEFDFERIDAAAITGVLRPFDLGHGVALARRAGWLRLDSMEHLRSARPIQGFAQISAPQPEAVASGRVYHVFPFVPPHASFQSLAKLLLMHSAPTLMSVRLRPTSLRPEEVSFLLDMIANCETHAQVGLGPAPERLDLLHPTLQRRAVYLQELFLRSLHGLGDDAALMTIEVASPEPIPLSVSEGFAHMLTEPASVLVGQGDALRSFAGGFRIIELDETTSWRRNFTEAVIAIPPTPDLAPGAQRLPFLFDSAEATAGFRLPPAAAEPLWGMEGRRWRIHPAPATLPLAGILVGRSAVPGATQDVRIEAADRLRHMYLLGQTGTGKTTMLKTMILDDIRSGHGVCVVDPHGDLFKEILGAIPDRRINDVVVLDPSDVEHPVGLNLLERADESQRHFVVQEMVSIISRVMADEYGEAAREMTGPMFYRHVRNNLLVATSDPDRPGTLLDFSRIFSVPKYWRRWLPLKATDEQTRLWVEKALPSTDYYSRGSDGIDFGSYFASKFDEFIFDPMLANIFGQPRSSIDLRAIMDGGKILLVNLAKGLLTEATSRFLGMIVLAKVQAAAMSRVRMREQDRRPFFLYVDEFQSIATQNFISLLSEGRKFGLGLVLANQFVTQLEDRRIVESVFGNVGTIVCFRAGQSDAEIMERYFAPAFDRQAISRLPNWHAAMTTLVGGESVQPFMVETVPDPTRPDGATAERARVASRKKFSRPRAVVERELAESLKPPETSS